MVVDLRRSVISSLLCTRQKMVVPKSSLNPVHRVDLLGAMIGQESPPPLPRLGWGPDHDRRADQILEKVQGSFLAIAPTANWQGKIWPSENFIQLIADLTGPGGCLSGVPVAVFGGPGEREQAAPVLEAVPEASLLDLGSLLSSD